MEDLNIGKKVQKLRLQSGISVRKLSSIAGITPSMLSQIENEQVNPSINTLRAIASALNAPLYYFFKEDAEDSPVVTPDTRKTIGRKGEPDVLYTGEEVAFLYSGESVDLEIDSRIFTLRQGDSVRIPPESLHIWHNKGNAPVQVIFAITPPSF